MLFTGLRPDQAQVSSYFTVVTHIGLDHFGRYRDTLVPDGDTWLIQHRKVSTDWAAANSAMAAKALTHSRFRSAKLAGKRIESLLLRACTQPEGSNMRVIDGRWGK